MASSAGNPNQPSPFDMHRLFNPNPPNATNPPPSSYPAPPSPYPTPPPPGPFSYPPPTTPTPPFHHYLHYPHQEPFSNMHHRPISYPAPSPPLNPSTAPNPNLSPNHGARLMALLTPSPPSPSSNLDPPSGPTPSAPMLPPISSAGPMPPPPARVPSSKLLKGRHLVGDRAVYDVDARLPGEAQPQQLEVTPITKYTSDPALIVGRQIAVNRTYICYGLKLGAIRVLNINTALRSLLRGHTQRVTDMAFFAEDVHLLASAGVDGRVYVWKINEGPEEEDKPQITGKAVVAIQIFGDGESVHPRICWHTHKQEVLIIGIGNSVLKLDTTKVGKGDVFSAEEPLKCPVDKLINGVQLVGKHEGEVTDLSICQWMMTRLVSASKDGTVKIWEDQKTLPLLTLRPHDGQPVNSVTFVTAPHRPDHVILFTAGHLNQEVKVWASASQEGWLLPSDAESWQCTQTLELKSSAEPRAEEAFFNQVVALPCAGLILLANAKKNAIYAIHLDYGPYPLASRMDYITEFTVTMPILSLTGTSDSLPDGGEHVLQIYCVQTQAIQQYALDLLQCLPPPMENLVTEKDSSISHAFEASSSSGFNSLEPSPGNVPPEMLIASSGLKQPSLVSRSESAPAGRIPVFGGAPELPNLELATSSMESRPNALLSPTTDTENVRVASPPLPLSPRLSGRLSGMKSPLNGFEPGPSHGDHGVDQPVEYSVDAVVSNMPDVPSIDDSSRRNGSTVGQNDISVVPNPPVMFKHPTHLITPAEILSTVVSSSSENAHIARNQKGGEMDVQDVGVSNDADSVEVEVKVVGESGLVQHEDFDPQKEDHFLVPEKKERYFYSQASGLNLDMARECCSLPMETLSMEGPRSVESVGVEQPPNGGEDEIQDSIKDGTPGMVSESAAVATVAELSTSAVKGKKSKEKISQISGPSSTSPSPFNSTDSSNEPCNSLSGRSMEAALSQIMDMQNQMMTLQKEMLKQMNGTVAGPINKEGRRLETSLGRAMEKAIKANTDALWARIQEENAKQKLERDRIQQTMTSMSNWNKDLPSLLEKTLKKEISSVGPAIARTITPGIEKAISSAIAETFQRGVGDKAISQLDKSVSSKIEASVARQIQAQFQTSGKLALQEALRSSLESSLIPAFEVSCKAMFEQVDAVFQKGMIEHITTAQRQIESTHSPLAIALRDAMSSATTLTQTLSAELVDGQRKILALVTNQSGINPLTKQHSNGLPGGLHDMVEPPLDPKKELQVLVSERKFEEAFTTVLQRSDVSIVSWLCSQVDLAGILSTIPLPLSQGVLLALLQQLACDIANETSRKLEWLRDVAVAINPMDPTIAVHVRRIFEQVYQILGHQRTVPTTTAAEGNSIRLVMHVINSVLMSSCK